MTPTSAEQLQPWLDPEDLLRSIVAVDRDEISTLADELAALVLHDDPDVREEAIRKLYTQGKNRSGRDLLLNVLRHDESTAVRETAALAIAATSSGCSRVEDARQLVRLLLDNDAPEELRGAAYEALLVLYGRRDFPSLKREVDLKTDVDWTWVRALDSTLAKEG